MVKYKSGEIGRLTFKSDDTLDDQRGCGLGKEFYGKDFKDVLWER